MNTQNHDVDLAGAYVLDALESEERDEFEDHLRGCAECRLEVLELREVVDALPLLCDPLEPSAAVRDRIVAAVRADEGTGPQMISLAGGLPSRRQRDTRRPLAVLMSAVAAMVIFGLGLWDVQLQRKVNDQRNTISLQQNVVAALAAGGKVMPVPGTSEAPGATAAMVQPAHHGKAYFLVQGLPDTPANKTYQLWLVRGSTPYSAGTFRYSGSGPETVQVPMPASGFSVAAVTVEPGPSGSKQPTGMKLLLGKLQA